MNNVPETLDFSQIYHGMIGRDFITAFNSNFNTVDTNIIQILGDLIYRVKSNDVKELRISQGVVEYTQDEVEPKTWQAIDITAWGNINGNIEDQIDLKNALDAKAAASTVATLESLVNTININLSNTTSAVNAANIQINNNTNSINSILTTLSTKVSSSTIKEIRINANTFQWSPDGINWYQQEVVTDISWGHIIGDITQQTDLQTALGALEQSIQDLETAVSALQSSYSTLRSTVESHTSTLSSYGNRLNDIETAIADIPAIQASLATKASAADLTAHIQDTSNPHGVTKVQLGLGNVDNTSDVNKPLSTAQKTYVDEQIATVTGQADLNTVVRNRNKLENIAIASTNEYFNFAGDYANIMTFVNDYIDLSYSRVESAKLSGTGSSEDLTDLRLGNSLDNENHLVFTITNINAGIIVKPNRVSVLVVNNNNTTYTEYFDLTNTINYNESYSITTALSPSLAVSIRESTIIVSYKAEEVGE